MGVTKGAQGGQRQGGMETRFDEIPSIKSRIICGIIIKPPPPLLHLPCWNWWWGVWSWVGPIRWLYIWHLEGIFHWTKWPDKKLVCKQRRLRAIVTKVLLNAVVGEYRGTAVQTEAVTTSSGRIQPVFSSPLTNLPLTSQPHYFSHILILFIFIPGTNVTQLKLNVDQEVCCCRQLRNSKKELVICCISCSCFRFVTMWQTDDHIDRTPLTQVLPDIGRPGELMSIVQSVGPSPPRHHPIIIII